MHQVKELLQAAVKKVLNEDVSIELTRPEAQFGDFATNIALQLAQKVHQSPRNVAEQIVAALPENDVIASTSIAGPGFINVTVEGKFLAHSLKTEIENTKPFGSSEEGKGKTVICEFPSPNMAKPFSVGHLRSALQGWTLYKLMKFMGYEVFRDNHVGDSGTPFGKWVVGFLHFSSDEQLEQDGIYELARIYIEVTEAIKREKEQDETTLQDEVQQWLQKLEAGNDEAVAYSERFNKLSFDHMHEMMQRLKIEVDEELGESFYVQRGQELTDDLLQKGVAAKSDGAVVVDLEDEGIDTPIMLRKANGTALYATTDLATIDYRQERWKPEKVFIHTGQEQAFYFKQLKALTKKAGYQDVIVHLWHGLVDMLDERGNRAKMSSRKGVVLLEELLNNAEQKAAEIAKDTTEADTKAIALGAVKFADFKADRKTGLLFDWDDMFSLSGFSGPAVQYAAVRINSILDKAHDEKVPCSETYDWAAEKQLLLRVSEFPALIRELHENYQMQKLAHYLYELASEFNRYYEKAPILKADADTQSCRLWTIQVVRDVLTNGLDILGIAVPQKM